MDPAMLMGALGAPGAGGPPPVPPMGVPMGAPPPQSPAGLVMAALAPAAQAQDAAMAQMQSETQMLVMQALQGNPAGLAAVSGPVAPGSLDAVDQPADGAAEGEGEVY